MIRAAWPVNGPCGDVMSKCNANSKDGGAEQRQSE